MSQCYIDERTHPAYRKPATGYTFIFNATNLLDTEGLITVHKVDHYAIGKKVFCVQKSLVLVRCGSDSGQTKPLLSFIKKIFCLFVMTHKTFSELNWNEMFYPGSRGGVRKK